MSTSPHVLNIAENLRDLARDQLTGCTTNTSNAVMIQNIATAIAYAIPLPTSELTDVSPEDYYNSYHRWSVMRLVESINEEFLIDTSAIARVAVQMWILRYRMVYSPSAIAGILYVMATADGVFPEFVQEGVAEFHKTVGAQASTQESYNDISTAILQEVSRHLNQKKGE